MSYYKTNGNLNYNGTLYKPNSKVKIDDVELAEQLLAAAVISTYQITPPATEEVEKKATKKKSIVSIVETPETTEEAITETQVTLGV